jgi:hypothetical protein
VSVPTLAPTPWNCPHADQLLEAGWRWCATNRRWFRTRRGLVDAGVCQVCRDAALLDPDTGPRRCRELGQDR